MRAGSGLGVGLVLLGILVPGAGWARIIHVDRSAVGRADGASWVHAYSRLEAALEVAGPGDEVHVAAGVYRPRARHLSFQLRAGVSVFGGWPAGGDGPRDYLAHPVILSGDVAGDDVNADGNLLAESVDDLVGENCHTILTAAAGERLTTATVLDGLVFTAGRADGLGAAPDASNRGGAVYLEGGGPSFRDCIFMGNEARQGGGAVCIDGGGAVLPAADAPVFRVCQFTGNSCGSTGGALLLLRSGAVIEACNFWDNRGAAGAALGVDGAGGGATVERTAFFDNVNPSDPSGGAIFVGPLSGGTSLHNCRLTGNGGNGVTVSGPAAIRNCTIVGNRGRPVWKTGGALVVWNAIFWGNQSGFGSDGGGSPAEVHHSLVEGFGGLEDGFRGNGNLDGSHSGNDPRFVLRLGWQVAPSPGGNYQLRANSPALSAGMTAEGRGVTDLAGNPRVSGHRIDLGCFEYQLPDADRDGLADDFELAHTSPSSATALAVDSNSDGDPFTALEEFAYGLDPNRPDGHAEVFRTVVLADPWRLGWIHRPDAAAVHFVRIVAERSSDLGGTDPWVPIASTPADALPGGQPGELVATTAGMVPLPPQQFLRFRVVGGN